MAAKVAAFRISAISLIQSDSLPIEGGERVKGFRWVPVDQPLRDDQIALDHQRLSPNTTCPIKSRRIASRTGMKSRSSCGTQQPPDTGHCD
jgi:hypothetical protein